MLYKIILDNDNNGRVYLPKDFNNDLKHETSSFSKISAGLKECNIQSFTDSTLNSDIIKISNDLMSNLSIPQVLLYQIQCKDKTIKLGPVIGLLLGKKNVNIEKKLEKYLPYTFLCNKNGGLLYVFSLDGINYDNQLIKGFFFNAQTFSWEKATLPFPQSIFRRINLSKNTIKKLQTATGGRMFNSNYFDKWKFWNVAYKYPQLAKHLPYTKLLKSISDIDNMFKSYATLFLKPAAGTLGRGLVQVVKNKNQYVFKERDIKKPIITYNKEMAIKYVGEIKQNRSKYIVQQFIDLLKFEDRYADFRVIMQKDNTMKWQCTGIVVSMGEPDGICSNYPGSIYFSFEDFFSQYLTLSEVEVSQKKHEIITLCTRVCEVLDVEMGNYGDVGIDIGIDRSLKPWIFEVNKKHFHMVPTLIDDYTSYLNVKRNPIKYAISLSGFDII